MYMYKRVVEAKCYIDQHFARKIELDNISNEACFSKYHFLRLFKQAYGKSPHQYLTEVRIREAKKLLSSGCSVSEACFAVGFTSIPSFTHLFRKHVGHPPRAFADQRQALLQEVQDEPLRGIPACFAENFGWKAK